MAALGHGAPGAKLKDRIEKKKAEEQELEQEKKKEKSGVNKFVLEQHSAALAATSESVRETIAALVDDGVQGNGGFQQPHAGHGHIGIQRDLVAGSQVKNEDTG